MGEVNQRSGGKNIEIFGKVLRRKILPHRYRWEGVLEISAGVRGIIRLHLPGSVIQWLNPGEEVKLIVSAEKEEYTREEIELYRKYAGEWVKIYPLFSKEVVLAKKDPLTGRDLYSYRILVKEADTEREFEAIAELEQYHYASNKKFVAIWACPKCGKLIESNVKPKCDCGEEAVLVEIRGSLPVSRFLVLKLLDKEPFEPEVIGYLRVDPPVPLMHRRINGRIVKYIRERVFPVEWFHPTFWPEKLAKKLKEKYSGLSLSMFRKKIFELVRQEAIKRCNTAAARISRVVIHPDYRGDGLGTLAVKTALEWITAFRVPEMRKKKELVEVIAKMARYHPFFERVGFIYLWDTASGRPVLYYPLTEKARKIIADFLSTDPIAKHHGGKLFRPVYCPASKISGPIILEGIEKGYEDELNLEGLPEKVREVLRAFGVESRVVQKKVLRGVNLKIEPGEVVAVVGISGAGKTTLLKLIAGLEKPDGGSITLPEDTKIAVLIPWEVEPEFGDKSLLERLYELLGDETAAIEVLNIAGLSDAVYFRARFNQLSTGQKERAKIAALLAQRPNVIIIDEFAAHLDYITARKVARKLVSLARKFGITLILVVHRGDVLEVLNPDKIVFVGYGGVKVEKSLKGDRNDVQ